MFCFVRIQSRRWFAPSASAPRRRRITVAARPLRGLSRGRTGGRRGAIVCDRRTHGCRRSLGNTVRCRGGCRDAARLCCEVQALRRGCSGQRVRAVPSNIFINHAEFPHTRTEPTKCAEESELQSNRGAALTTRRVTAYGLTDTYGATPTDETRSGRKVATCHWSERDRVHAARESRQNAPEKMNFGATEALRSYVSRNTY